MSAMAARYARAYVPIKAGPRGNSHEKSQKKSRTIGPAKPTVRVFKRGNGYDPRSPSK
jgi:hypothetical protein